MIYHPRFAIKTEAQYERALRTLDMLLDNDAACTSIQRNCRIESLLDDIEAYENIHYPIDPPTRWQLFVYRLQNWSVKAWVQLFRDFCETMYGYDVREQTGIE